MSVGSLICESVDRIPNCWFLFGYLALFCYGFGFFSGTVFPCARWSLDV